MAALVAPTVMVAFAVAGDESAELPPPCPRIHAFYYPWYGNPDTDGHWRQWNHVVAVRDGDRRQHQPPEDIGSDYYPQIGLYSSNAEGDLEMHMGHLRRARVGVIALSWWGQGDFTNAVVPKVLDAAERHGIKVDFHIEPFAGRNAQTTKEAIGYLVDTYGSHPAFYRDPSRGNRPVFFVYDSYLTSAEEWATVLRPGGEGSLRGTSHDAIVIGLWVKEGDGDFMVEGHFDGYYTYFATDGFTFGSTAANWKMLAGFAQEHRLLFIPSIGPGYIDTSIRPWNGVNTRDREAGVYYDRMWQAALGVEPEVVSITSFNEWHEGTQIEPAVPKSAPGREYLDYGPRKPEFYLDRTAYWVQKLLAEE